MSEREEKLRELIAEMRKPSTGIASVEFDKPVEIEEFYDVTSLKWADKLEALLAETQPTPTNPNYLADLKRDLSTFEYRLKYLLACAMDSSSALRIGLQDVEAEIRSDERV